MKKHDLKTQEMAAKEINSHKKGLTVKVFTNNKGYSDINSALRTLKRQMNREGVLKDLRKHEYFESKGQRRRREKAEAIRRYKRERKELQESGNF